MNICIVTHVLRLTDGQGRVNYETARYLARQGHSVTLVSSTIDPVLAAEPNITWLEVSVPDWLALDLFRYQVFALGAYRTLNRRKSEFDIIHLNGAITFIAADVNASHFVHSDWLKSPYHTARVTKGLYALYQRCVTILNACWERKAYKAALCVVAVSDKVRNSLIKQADVTASKIEVIYNGVDTDEFHPRRTGEPNLLRETLGIPDDAFLAFFSGGIKTNRKNLDLPLQAIAALGPRYHLVVVGTDGGGPYPKMASELEITDRVHFLGHRDDVASLLRDADAFVFASHYDPCPLVIFEALASAIPVVTAPSVGSAAVIQHGENGFVIKDSNDLEGLIHSIKLLAEDAKIAHQIAQSGRETAQNLTWEAMAKRYESLYQKIYATKNLNKAAWI